MHPIFAHRLKHYHCLYPAAAPLALRAHRLIGDMLVAVKNRVNMAIDVLSYVRLRRD